MRQISSMVFKGFILHLSGFENDTFKVSNCNHSKTLIWRPMFGTFGTPIFSATAVLYKLFRIRWFTIQQLIWILNWIELNWIELNWIELNWIESNRIDWIELNWIELNWIELNWIELNWTELNIGRKLKGDISPNEWWRKGTVVSGESNI